MTNKTRSDLVAAAAAANASNSEGGTPIAAAGAKPKRKPKYACGKCGEETNGTETICCNICEIWFHSDCVEGMTKQWVDSIKKTWDMLKVSTFLCRVCRKVWTNVNAAVKELKKEVVEMGNRVKALEMEKEAMAQKMEKTEMKADKAAERVVGGY